jgi:hypothetical protein
MWVSVRVIVFNAPFNKISTFLFIHLFQKLSFPCNELKIEVDQTVADEWIELDAVEVIGSVTGMYLLISEIYICLKKINKHN